MGFCTGAIAGMGDGAEFVRCGSAGVTGIELDPGTVFQLESSTHSEAGAGTISPSGKLVPGNCGPEPE